MNSVSSITGHRRTVLEEQSFQLTIGCGFPSDRKVECQVITHVTQGKRGSYDYYVKQLGLASKISLKTKNGQILIEEPSENQS